MMGVMKSKTQYILRFKRTLNIILLTIMLKMIKMENTMSEKTSADFHRIGQIEAWFSLHK